MFALAILLSAALLFAVQPLIGRAVLPWFGGSVGVWTTCLMFFQTTLVGGYAYSHLVSRRLRYQTQGRIHAGLLIASAVALPILPGPGWKPNDGEWPVLRLLLLLIGTVGLPFFVLSSTGPLLQTWFARKHSGASPYRLYALSNAASLTALLAYPIVIEPLLPLRYQNYGWSAIYVVFICVCSYVASSMRHADTGIRALEETKDAVGVARRFFWIALAWCPSELLAGVTSHITQNVAPIPLFWTAPLALYLLSFVLTFGDNRWYARRFWTSGAVAVAAAMLCLLLPAFRSMPVAVAGPVFLIGFFVCAVACHGELYRLRPGPSGLTGFYLFVAIGGALGGAFVAGAAPLLFRDYFEVPLALFGVMLLMGLMQRDLPPLGFRYAFRTTMVVSALATAVFLTLWFRAEGGRQAILRTQVRSFYGVLRVVDVAGSDHLVFRELQHGSILHGVEFVRQDLRRIPLAYYGYQSGIGMVLRRGGGPRRVGLIGLGVGSLAGYARPGDTYRFYEIDPAVIDVARSHFFYLHESPAKVEIVQGDARTSLEREEAQDFDVLVVDAFSGDSIPVHLLTVEAFGQYLRHLKSGGVLALHISNNYLGLRDVTTRAAAAHGLSGTFIEVSNAPMTPAFASAWMVFENRRNPAGVAGRPARPWTDDYSNLLGAVDWRRIWRTD